VSLFSDTELFSGDPLEPDMVQVCPAEIVAGLTKPQREHRVQQLVAQAHEIVDRAWEKAEGRMRAAWCVLYSGGNDSTVLAHLMKSRVDYAVHCNTTIGIEETRQFVRDTCQQWGLPLLERTAPQSYRDLVLERGFPGPAMHFKMYQRLKERALDEVRREIITNSRTQRVMFIAGRRRAESKRRANIPLWETDGSAIWASPLAMWTKLDMNTYRLMRGDVPVNQVSEKLHMSGECLCLAPGTLISTETGWRPIADVEVGDRVHNFEAGTLTLAPVAEVYRNEPKPMLSLKAHYLPAIEATENHPIWVRDYRYQMNNKVPQIGPPRYEEAGQIWKTLQGSKKESSPSKKRMYYIGRPFRTEVRPLGLTEAQLKLLGFFVAEGAYIWRRDRYRDKAAGIIFTVSTKSRDMAEEIASSIREGIGGNPGWREYRDNRTGRDFIMIRDGRQAASKFVAQYTTGRYCWEKALSPALMAADPVQQKVLLDAMWWGDGSEFTRSTGEMVSAYGTTSKGLALQVQELLLRQGEVYGVNTSSTHERPSYLVRKTIRSTGKAKSAFIEDGVLWSSLRLVHQAEPQPTFNLMIAGESNYLTEGGLVHNCGSYAKPGELEEIRFWFPEVAAEIDALQAEVSAAGHDSPFDTWGHGQGKPPEKSGPLCTSCDFQMQLWEEAS